MKNVKDLIEKVNPTRRVYQLPAIKILGIVPSNISTNARFLESTFIKRKKLVESRYGIPIFDTIICNREEVSRASEDERKFGDIEIPSPQSILDYKPESKSSQEFASLAEEILAKIED